MCILNYSLKLLAQLPEKNSARITQLAHTPKIFPTKDRTQSCNSNIIINP